MIIQNAEATATLHHIEAVLGSRCFCLPSLIRSDAVYFYPGLVPCSPWHCGINCTPSAASSHSRLFFLPAQRFTYSRRLVFLSFISLISLHNIQKFCVSRRQSHRRSQTGAILLAEVTVWIQAANPTLFVRNITEPLCCAKSQM